MKSRIVILLVLACTLSLLGQEKPQLQIQLAGSALELSWPAQQLQPDGAIAFPAYEIQSSGDLRTWQPIGERLRGNASLPEGLLRLSLQPDRPRAFYRLVGHLPRAGASLVTDGAEVFGYAAAFSDELGKIGYISAEQFVALYDHHPDYLSGLTFDPTTAQFWDRFNTDIEAYNAGKPVDDPTRRHTDYRLNTAELATFKQNGFVVSERLGSSSFADVFYKLWKDDLPVFISVDAILQAWHRTYDAMLEELEETYLLNALEKMLRGMTERIPDAWAQAGGGVLKDSLLDADYFLAVARSLLAGTNVPSRLGQDAHVAQTLQDVAAQQLKEVELFGTNRVMDFSQFKVRGHYENSPLLGRYFQAMMWCGRTDFRVAGESTEQTNYRELGAAIVLWHLLNQAGEFPTWQNFDRILQAFVGWTDSMTFAQLGSLLAAANIRSLADVPDQATLQRLVSDLLKGDIGAQNIRSDYFVSPLGTEQINLPRSFTVLGQKFVLDSWAMAKLVYDEILWAADGATNKVWRRLPSALDVAFAVLGNDQIVSELVGRISNSQAAQSGDHMVRFRDGMPYQHNLAAVRNVITGQQPSAWEENIYTGWLAALRELSAPTTAPQYPEAMRTRAWAMKTLNTQLASWTQLRHDTILYAKQSYTGVGICSYPDGFVEPRPPFWARLRQTLLRTASLLEAVAWEGTGTVIGREFGGMIRVEMSAVQAAQLRHLRNFADAVGTLQSIAGKELAQTSLTPAETQFIRDLIQVQLVGQGSGSYRTYTGWYPALFYQSVGRGMVFNFHETYGAGSWDAIVADVHTDLPDPLSGDPGSVLHEGIGNVNLLMIAIDNGPDRMVCAGPVLSHYEFEIVGLPTRKSDSEWRDDYRAGRWPSAPEWTRGYLIPSKP